VISLAVRELDEEPKTILKAAAIIIFKSAISPYGDFPLSGTTDAPIGAIKVADVNSIHNDVAVLNSFSISY